MLNNLNTEAAPIRNLYSESLSDIFHQGLHEYGINVGESEIVNEYDQEIPQSQTADNPVAP